MWFHIAVNPAVTALAGLNDAPFLTRQNLLYPQTLKQLLASIRELTFTLLRPVFRPHEEVFQWLQSTGGDGNHIFIQTGIAGCV